MKRGGTNTKGRDGTSKKERSIEPANTPAEEEKRIKDECKTSLSDWGISPDDLNRLIDEAWNHLVKDQDWKKRSFSKNLEKRVIKDHVQQLQQLLQLRANLEAEAEMKAKESQLTAENSMILSELISTSSQASSEIIGKHALKNCRKVSNFLVSGSVVPALGAKITKEEKDVIPLYLEKDGNLDDETKNVTLPLAVRLASYGADNFMVVCFAEHPWLLFSSHKPDILILNKQLMDACGLSDGLRTISYALVDMVIEAKSSPAFEENGDLNSDGITAIGEVVKRCSDAMDMMGAVVDGKKIMFFQKHKVFYEKFVKYERSEMPKEYLDNNSEGFLELLHYAHLVARKIRNSSPVYLEICKVVHSKMDCPIVPLKRAPGDEWRSLVFGKIPGNQSATVNTLQKCESIIKVWWKKEKKNIRSFRREFKLLTTQSLAGTVIPKLISSFDKTILIEEYKYELHMLELSCCGSDTLESFVEKYSNEKSEAWSRTAPLLPKIGQKLVVLHEAGYLHSDVKPSNIVVNEDTSDVFLIDLEFAVKSGEIISGFTRAFAAQDILKTLNSALESKWSDTEDLFQRIVIRFRYDLESLFLSIKRLFIQHGYISDYSLYDPEYEIPLDKVNKRRVKEEESKQVIRYLHSFAELLRRLKKEEASRSAPTYDFSAVNDFFQKSCESV